MGWGDIISPFTLGNNLGETSTSVIAGLASFLTIIIFILIIIEIIRLIGNLGSGQRVAHSIEEGIRRVREEGVEETEEEQEEEEIDDREEADIRTLSAELQQIRKDLNKPADKINFEAVAADVKKVAPTIRELDSLENYEIRATEMSALAKDPAMKSMIGTERNLVTALETTLTALVKTLEGFSTGASPDSLKTVSLQRINLAQTLLQRLMKLNDVEIKRAKEKKKR